MATAKSLKKLRSASTAFLEDGGSFLHGVDGLLRDIQRTLDDLQRREEILVEREITLESREVCLNEMLEQLADRLSCLPPTEPLIQQTDHPPQTPPVNSQEPTAEADLSSELTEIQATVTEIVTPAVKTEPAKSGFAFRGSQRPLHHRKKRHR